MPQGLRLVAFFRLFILIPVLCGRVRQCVRGSSALNKRPSPRGTLLNAAVSGIYNYRLSNSADSVSTVHFMGIEHHG